MKNHGHKEPPLRNKVKHMSRTKINISYYISMAFLIAVFAMTLAGVTV